MRSYPVLNCDKIHPPVISCRGIFCAGIYRYKKAVVRGGLLIIGILLFQLAQDHFGRGEKFFLLITVQTADHHIAAGASAAAGNRHDVIQRQLRRRKLLMTVMADALPEKFLKIGRFPQFPGFGTLPFDMRFITPDLNPIIHFIADPESGVSRRQPPAAGAVWAEIRTPRHPADRQLPVRKQIRWTTAL